MPHELIPLTLDSVRHIKAGVVELMLAKALQRMAEDIAAAPDIGEWREVSLVIRAKPVCENLELDHVNTEFVVKGKVPSRSTSTTMLVRKSTAGLRQLVFNVDAQDNPNQMTLLEANDE